jgi:hypothetical protein
MAVAMFYSGKSYNPKFLFSDMLNAWGIPSLAAVVKLGDYCFRLEFNEEEKIKAIEGGPWRHRGDALLVVHYVGFTRPSEIHIVSIALWARFLDLPLAMMKESFTRQLGGQLGKYVKADTRYPSYMRVWVEYPLEKALVPSLPVKIKGRGVIAISIKYENVSHFCFSCGRIGHATANCEEEEVQHQGVRFGEDLKASPPRRVKEIAVQRLSSNVARPCSKLEAEAICRLRQADRRITCAKSGG